METHATKLFSWNLIPISSVIHPVWLLLVTKTGRNWHALSGSRLCFRLKSCVNITSRSFACWNSFLSPTLFSLYFLSFSHSLLTVNSSAFHQKHLINTLLRALPLLITTLYRNTFIIGFIGDKFKRVENILANNRIEISHKLRLLIKVLLSRRRRQRKTSSWTCIDINRKLDTNKQAHTVQLAEAYQCQPIIRFN